ncbi:MAG: RidA family protein [Pseudomonadota bacterium]|nr:RidA family protein [Pseudomonadota bacterium]
MSIERFHVGPRMSQVVVHNGTVYTAGQVAQNAGGGTVTAQTEDILAAIDGLLANAGSDKSRLLSATIWLNSMDDFAEMNAVWDAWVASGATPVRACVESPRLASPKYTVEIMVVAATA